MPYKKGNRLPGERASKIGHIDIINSPLAKKLVKSFESKESIQINPIQWQHIPLDERPLNYVFCVDGSMQSIISDGKPFRRLGFVKTAMTKLNLEDLNDIDIDFPHPLKIKNMINKASLYHATVFPLQNASISGLNNYHTIRRIIYESINDDSEKLDKEPMETLKWIAYEKWSSEKKDLPLFQCPHCEEEVATLPYDQNKGRCKKCKQELLITDMLGFHQTMGTDSAPDSIATDYMMIHETLLLFSAIKYFWENKRKKLSNCLFLKDGPLSIRAQYSKLVNPIRRFLDFANAQGYPIHILGQEKTGQFVDYLELINSDAPLKNIFIPSDYFIKQNIQHRPLSGAPYGKDTNYGAKIFVKWNNYHSMVINIPTGNFNPNPSINDLIGAKKIFATIPLILSNKYEGALFPIELTNGIASLSTYPSSAILKMFSET